MIWWLHLMVVTNFTWLRWPLIAILRTCLTQCFVPWVVSWISIVAPFVVVVDLLLLYFHSNSNLTSRVGSCCYTWSLEYVKILYLIKLFELWLPRVCLNNMNRCRRESRDVALKCLYSPKVCSTNVIMDMVWCWRCWLMARDGERYIRRGTWMRKIIIKWCWWCKCRWKARKQLKAKSCLSILERIKNGNKRQDF